MRKLLFLYLFLPLLLTAQPVEVRVIPTPYEQEYKKATERAAEIIRTPDKVVLDPIEQTPIAPTGFTAQVGGNWGYEYYGLKKHEIAIRGLAKRPVVVFIFDTGVPDHVALKKTLWPEMHKLFTGEEDFLDLNGHSTHVSGIYGAIDGSLNTGLCAALVEAGKFRIVCYKVLRNEGWGYNESIIAGIVEANTQAPKLIADGYFVIYNFSLGSKSVNAVFDQLIKEAENLGVFVVAAAGNQGEEFIATPANGPSAHAVAALDPAGNRANYSDFGPQMYMAAPGTRIYSTWKTGRWVELSGTSMATPGQGAIAAIVASIFPAATNRQISHFLKNYATDITPAGWDAFTGWGSDIVDKILTGDPVTQPDRGNGNPGGAIEPEPEPEPEPVLEKTPWWVFVILGLGVGGFVVYILIEKKVF